MERTTRISDRLALLVTPVVAASLTLALSACGSSAPGTRSAPATNPVPATNTAPADTSVPSGADVTQFCTTWTVIGSVFSQTFAVWGSDPSYDMSTPTVFLLPTMKNLSTDLRLLDQVEPAAVSNDMATLTGFWNAVLADFQYGTTVGDVRAYVQAHPPVQATAVGPAVQDLSNYVRTTCNVAIGS